MALKIWLNTIVLKKNNDKPGEYGKDCIEIKFNSNNLLWTKILKLHSLTIVVRSVL